MEIIAHSVSDLKSIAAQWLAKNPNPTICLINGEMGAGKTTFIKEICSALGVTETISSPTFSLVNEYISDSGMSIYHFDLYRLNDEEELYDLGFEEYLDQKHYVFIEWPEIGEAFYPVEACYVNISLKDGKRLFSF